MEELNLFCNFDRERIDLGGSLAKNEAGDIVFTFGKHKDKAVLDVIRNDPSYYQWMLKGNFSEDTKTKLRCLHTLL